MLPKTHILVGFIVSLSLFMLLPQIGLLGALIIFLSSFLIDFDHYLYYVLKQKDHSLRRAYYWFIDQGRYFKKLSRIEQDKYKRVIMIFHGVECWVILLLLLIFVNKVFLFILVGIAIHMILDFMDLIKRNQPLHIKTSQIYTHIKNKKRAELK